MAKTRIENDVPLPIAALTLMALACAYLYLNYFRFQPERLNEVMFVANIRDEHTKHGKKVKNLALTIIQSWHEKESDLFPPEKYNQMGQELAKRIAPGH